MIPGTQGGTYTSHPPAGLDHLLKGQRQIITRIMLLPLNVM
jgi:hypothetical protein